MGIILNEQQQEAHILGVKWWKSSKQLFQLAGLAGTGKSTIINSLIQTLGLKPEEVIFCCFTGKAAQLLNMKGMRSKTIHGTFYYMKPTPKLDENNEPIVINGRLLTYGKFQKRERISPKIKLVVIDEGGMVGERLAKDILSFGIKVIVLGDTHQLPPVLDKPFFFKHPDYCLTQIMRQAEGNPIIYLSQLIINGKKLRYGKYGNNTYIIKPSEVRDSLYSRADQILCAKNETRDKINSHVKHDLIGHKKDEPFIGEKIICRQNNWNLSIANDIYLINGLIGYIDDIYLQTYNNNFVEIDFRPDFIEKEAFPNLKLDLRYYNSNYEKRRNFGRSFFTKFESAYAISVHLSQGSEYNQVLYFKENIGGKDYQSKLDYTAVTRAKEDIIIVVPEPKKYIALGAW